MPRDILNLASLRIVEHNDEEYTPLEETPKIKSNQQRGPNQLNNQDALREDKACYYNYGVNDSGGKYHDAFYQFKTNSLPGANSISHGWDDMVCSVLNISPEDLANQLTLLDMPCFKAIQPDELTTCGWNKGNKLTVAPNVVAFTKRFNRVSFWTVQEILNGETPKARAEVMAHFIKLAKKLYDLNNIHSLFAVVSALRSVSVFRLTKSWTCLPKRDKQMYEKLAEIFAEDDNWSTLRAYLKSLPLPCIPYLGIFLTDLVYIDIAHPLGSPHRSVKMAVVLKALEKYQTSEYNLTPLPRVTSYLSSVRYIEELQKFVEDDQYKLSLKLEGPSPAPSCSSSKESIKETGAGTPFSMSPSHRPASSSFRAHGAASINSKFHPTHRKCRSLGTKFRSTSLPRNFHKVTFGGGSIFGKSHAEETDRSTPVMSLLDDTLLESPGNNKMSVSLQQGPIGDIQHALVVHQGCLKRKTVTKEGRKPALSSWQRYWVQIYTDSLVYFSPKSFKGVSRSEFRTEPCKVVPLEGWTATAGEGEANDTFLLVNHHANTIYKFKTASEETAKVWISKILEANSNIVTPLPDNLLSFE